MRHLIAMTVGVALLPTSACTDSLPEGCDAFVTPGSEDDDDVQRAFLEAEQGQTVCLAAGTFELTRELTISGEDLVIRGESQEKTILDFSAQDVGGNGIKITGDGVVVSDLTIKNTPGDGVRAENVAGITFIDTTVRWDAMMGEDNGDYGLYPVGSSNVLIQRCTVVGARDAGIYVGQSAGIVVEHSLAWGNVAGIEIENSFDAYVFDNEARNNTGGILVFNLPGLEVKNGERTLVSGNDIHHNNLPNWGMPGTAVSSIPAGTGIIVLASDRNEIRGNDIHDNDSAGVVVVGYFLLDPSGEFETTDPEFDPYAEANYIHDNVFWANGTMPDAELVAPLVPVRPVPPLLFDGCVDPTADNTDGSLTNCLSRNSEQSGEPAAYFDVDICGNFMNQNQDIDAVTCQHPEIPDPPGEPD